MARALVSKTGCCRFESYLACLLLGVEPDGRSDVAMQTHGVRVHRKVVVHEKTG
jgi:hypothetical protein